MIQGPAATASSVIYFLVLTNITSGWSWPGAVAEGTVRGTGPTAPGVAFPGAGAKD